MPRILLIVALLVAFLLYRPGLHGPFVFDDTLNIVNNPHLKLEEVSKASLLQAAYSVPNGVFGRPISMLSFAFNFFLDRDKVEPFPSAYTFKITNLVIHLLNGIAIFFLTRLLTSLYRQQRQPSLPVAYPEWLALFVAAAWLLHPLNLTSVLYVVQRMASLAALFCFIGLGIYVWGRSRLYTGQRGGVSAILVSFFVFLPLAVLSKDNGVLLPVFMLIAEIILFRFETAQPITRRFLIVFFTLLVAVPSLLVVSYLVQHPAWILEGYARRDFSLFERLLTEPRVIWFYLRLILLPSTALMGLYHDDIAISHNLFDPVGTLPAILGLLALLFAAWWFRRRQPLVVFGIFFFLVGHGPESTFFPLELVHEHRNYLPSFGILLAFFHLLLNPISVVSTRLPRVALACLLIPLFAVGTLSRATTWSNSQDLWTAEVENHPASVRANLALADLYANALAFDPAAKAVYYQFARQYYERTLALDPHNTNGLFGLIQLNLLHGKPVEQAWLTDLNYGLAHKTIPSNTNDQLISLAMCTTQPGCPLKAADIAPLMQAPLRNPKVTGRDKALIYNALTVYLFKADRDYPAALEATRQAIALAPGDMDHQLWLANILIAMKHTDEAQQQIARLKQLDSKNLQAKEIAQIEEQLAHGN
jgi:tetratricopeptide (TPR) repeat protein